MRRVALLALTIHAAGACAPRAEVPPTPVAPAPARAAASPTSTSNATSAPGRGPPPLKAIVLYTEEASWFGFIAPGGPGCALPCTLWLPRRAGVLRLTRYGAEGPDYELDVDDLGEPAAPYTAITISRTKSHAAMGSLIGAGALAALVGATVLGVAAGNERGCDAGSCGFGGTFLGIGATLVVLGVIVGPRERTVLSVGGSER